MENFLIQCLEMLLRTVVRTQIAAKFVADEFIQYVHGGSMEAQVYANKVGDANSSTLTGQGRVKQCVNLLDCTADLTERNECTAHRIKECRGLERPQRPQTTPSSTM